MDDEQLYMPRPVTVTMSRFREIQDSYLARRQSQNSVAALRGALTHVLNPRDLEEVLTFIDGGRDSTFGTESGEAFEQELLYQLEVLHHQVAAYDERAARRSSMGFVDFAEDLATDHVLAAAFRQAIDENDLPTANGLLDDAVELVLQSASTARLKTGQKFNVKRARSIFRLLSSKARHVAGNRTAENQAVWCAALADCIESSSIDLEDL